MAARKLAEGARFSGALLRARREKAKLTRLELIIRLRGHGVTVTEGTVYRWEENDKYAPGADELAALLHVLNLSRLEDLYEVPASTEAVVSSIVVANRSTAATFRVSVAVAGGATANTDYLAYDAAIAANETIALTIGATLAATDVIRVYASSANLSFSAFGVELS